MTDVLLIEDDPILRDQIVEAFPGDTAPRFLIHDRDGIYGDAFRRKLKAMSIQAVRIGDLAICTLPFEVFAEIGLELKDRSPAADTFVVSLANGGYGYLPTPGQHQFGGYETWLSTNKFCQ